MSTGSFPGVEAAGAWGWPPTPYLERRGPRKSRAMSLLNLRAFVAYKKGENLPTRYDEFDRMSYALIAVSIVSVFQIRDDSALYSPTTFADSWENSEYGS